MPIRLKPPWKDEAMANNVVNVDNQFGQALDIYSFTVPQGASASDPSTLYPLYTKVGSAPANAKSVYTPTQALEDLTFVLVATGQPVATVVTNILSDTDITITAADLTRSQAAF